MLALALSGHAFAAEAPEQRLIEAARAQDGRSIHVLLANKVDVNTRSRDGSTALLWLVHWNDLDFARLLLAAGANPNAANKFQATPLSEACTNASPEMIGLLLEHGANPNTAIATGETPLMTCAKTGRPEAVRLLLRFGASVSTAEPLDHQTALMWAAARHHPEVVKLLIDTHANLTATTIQGFTAIHFAARVGDLESTKFLLAAGVDANLLTAPAPDDKNTARYTPLLTAVVRGQVDLALYLLDHGADPNNMDAGFTPLHWAAGTWQNATANPVFGFEDPMAGIPDRDAKLRLIKALITHGANVNPRMTKTQPSFTGGYQDCVGATPFLLAAAADDVEVMQVLLDAGADPKIRTATNASAIMAAAGLNRYIGQDLVTEAQAMKTVKLLLDLGIDPKGETTFGENALFGPAYRGWNQLLDQLIGLGVNVNAISKVGITPYLAANGQGDRLGGVLYNTQGAALLVKHGADPKLGHPCEAQEKCTVEQ